MNSQPISNYRTLFEHAPNIQFLLAVNADFNLTFEEVNRAFYKYTDLTPEQVIGRGIQDVFPDDVFKIRNIKFREAAELQKPDTFQTVTKWPKGVLTQTVRVQPIVNPAGVCTHLHVAVDPQIAGSVLLDRDDILVKFTEQLGFFNSLFDGTELAIIGFNLDGTIQEFNKGAENIFDFTREEVSNKLSILTFFDRSELQSLNNRLKKKYKDEITLGLDTLTYLPRQHNEPSRFNWTCFRKDGTEVPMRMTVTCVYDNLKQHTGYLCLGKDLTAETQSKVELQNFFDLTPDLVCIVSPEGKLVSFNNAFNKQLGYSDKEFRNATQFRDLMHPDDVPNLIQVLNRLSNGATIFDFEARFKHKNGEYIWFNWNLNANVTQGLFYGTGRNVTDQRLAREHLETINQTLGKYKLALDRMALVFAFDTQHRLIFANDNFYRTTGYSPSEVLGTDLDMLRVTEAYNHAERKNTGLKLMEEKIWRGETCNRAKDGSIFWLDNIAMVFENDPQWGSYIFTMGYDITERKVGDDLKIQNALLQKEKEVAEHNTKLKEQFLSNMSHEIRTPLNAIIGTGNLLLKSSNLNDRQKQYLSILSLNSKNLLNLINDILDLSKIESGNIQLVHQPFDLQKQLETLIDSVGFLADAKEIDLRLVQDALVQVPVLGDEVRLGQILMNLLSNAIKFTPALGNVTLAIHHISETTDQLTLQFTVTDSGIGIPPEKQQSIFDPFIQAEENTTRNYGGTGLGLNIVRKLIDLHQSEIHLKSEVGRGSEFTFAITFSKDLTHQLHAAPPKPIALPQKAPVVDYKSLAQPILLIEDNAFNQLVFKDTLHDTYPDLAIDVAENTKQALDYLVLNTYSHIFLDIILGDESGFDLATQIRAQLNLKTVPIIAMSALDEAQEANKLATHGINDYLPKPFEEKDLLEKLNKTYEPIQQ